MTFEFRGSKKCHLDEIPEKSEVEYRVRREKLYNASKQMLTETVKFFSTHPVCSKLI